MLNSRGLELGQSVRSANRCVVSSASVNSSNWRVVLYVLGMDGDRLRVTTGKQDRFLMVSMRCNSFFTTRVLQAGLLDISEVRVTLVHWTTVQTHKKNSLVTSHEGPKVQ